MMVPVSGAYVPGVVAHLLGGPPAKGGRPASRRKSAAKNAGRNRQRVLVVDDEDLIADSVTEILNRNGYDATAMYSGKAAIQSVKSQCPDIIVSDVIMPEFNGVELAKAVRLHCPNTRIFLFSGNAATPGLLQGALNDGEPFQLLAKPVHPLELLNALQS
jgi:CheY-like chemotaxis protein